VLPRIEPAQHHPLRVVPRTYRPRLATVSGLVAATRPALASESRAWPAGPRALVAAARAAGLSGPEGGGSTCLNISRHIPHSLRDTVRRHGQYRE